ncbi:MAG TPA: hypothetical protein VFR75_06705, partial [Solirubrobacterales bacterium]|nr:hypothetical protein [Solirubrobacterales bacterium]
MGAYGLTLHPSQRREVMRQLKVLVISMVGMVSFLSAFAGLTQAEVTTSPTGTTYTGTTHFKSKGHVTLANPIANISCNHTSVVDVNAHGAVITFALTETKWFNCTNSWH